MLVTRLQKALKSEKEEEEAESASNGLSIWLFCALPQDSQSFCSTMVYVCTSTIDWFVLVCSRYVALLTVTRCDVCVEPAVKAGSEKTSEEEKASEPVDSAPATTSDEEKKEPVDASKAEVSEEVKSGDGEKETAEGGGQDAGDATAEQVRSCEHQTYPAATVKEVKLMGIIIYIQ